MRATFENSVSVLVRAYINNTLEHTNCYACAVGNLVADANKLKYTKRGITGGFVAHRQGEERLFPMHWFDPILGDGKINKIFISSGTVKECESIGYSLQDVSKIESAFEGADQGLSLDEWVFNGLMAVVDVLAEIHCIDLTAKEEAKKLFVKA